MKLKKILAAAAASVMMLTMTACNNGGTSSGSTGSIASNGSAAADSTASSAASENSTASNPSTASAPESSTAGTSGTGDVYSGDKVFNIGICQLAEHPALDQATQGFMDELKAKLGEDHVKFDTQNAQGEEANCTTIINNFIAANVDLILGNATSPVTVASNATDKIPIVGTSVTDYASALGVKEGWSGKSGTNVTGTSDLAPIAEQEKLLLELFPDVKKVGILYCSAEVNSKYQANLFEEALTADGVAFKEFTATDANDIASTTQAAIGECDVLYIPTDNTFAKYTETVKNVVLPAKIPVIAGEEGICKGCGVATLSISYYDIGTMAGDMAYDILVNGKNPGEMEIQSAPKFTKKYNAEMCKELGITAPASYEAIATE